MDTADTKKVMHKSCRTQWKNFCLNKNERRVTYVTTTLVLKKLTLPNHFAFSQVAFVGGV